MGLFKSITYFLIICCWIPEAGAQFNDTTNYYLNFASTGIVNKTNDRNAFVLSNNFKFSLYKQNVSANITQGWVYGKQLGTLTNQDFSSALDFSLFKTLEHFYYWGLGTYEKSFSLKINNRYQAGLGIGYNVIDRKNALLVISDGILYEKSDLHNNIESGSNEYETFRNSFRFKFRFLIKDMVTIEGTDFLQHSLSDKKDYIIRSNTNLSVKLLRWLSFTTSLTYNKLNRTGRENLLINFGLTMERYF
jgi:hypothetical protein